MDRFKVKLRSRSGFTIVEILVVIAIIGILATISIVSYGAWRRSVTAAVLKSDLNGAVAAMDSYRTFNNGYPTTVPSSFKPSDGVILGGGSADTKTYCVEAASSNDATLVFYAASEVKDKGPQAGNCASRPTLPLPGIPGNLAVTSSVGTTVGLSWSNVVTDVASYDVQCASDAAFILGVKSASPVAPATSATISGLSLGNTYYCRIRAVNAAGTSAWSLSVEATTTNNYGSLAVATSIEGYWTSVPQGFLLEDGAAVSRTTYSDLFAVIGTTYGAGNGSTTFNLPDSRGRTSVNLSPSDTEFDQMGEKPGSKTEALTIAQIPSHTHIQNAHTHGVSDPGHNHAQNAHTHTTRNNPTADWMGLSGGGQGGWGLDAGTNNAIFRLITAPATATNNGSYTGISINNATATNQSIGGGGTHNNIQPSIVKLFVIKYSPVDVNATELPSGTSISGYWTDIPQGYLAEDGAAVSRTVYPDLFAVIGTTYGAGNGTTFNLPDSRGRTAVNKSSADTEFDQMGEKPGSKTEALTIAQIPSHTHIQNAHTHGVSDPGHNHTQNAHTHGTNSSSNGDAIGLAGSGGSEGGWGLRSTANGNIYQLTFSATTATNNGSYTGISINNATATNQSTGGGGAHNNIQPSIVKLSAIKYTAASGTITPPTAGTSIEGYWTSVPQGYLAEDGAAVSRTVYPDLFAVIGTTYGAGNGTTFNLPDSRGRTAVNKSSADTEFDQMGEKPGSKTEALTIAQIPSHTHIQNAHTHGVSDPGHNHAQNAHTHDGRSSQNGDFIGLSGGTQGGWGIASGTNNAIYRMGTTATVATNNGSYTAISINNATATNQSIGGGGTHNNIQPSIVKSFVIKY